MIAPSLKPFSLVAASAVMWAMAASAQPVPTPAARAASGVPAAPAAAPAVGAQRQASRPPASPGPAAAPSPAKDKAKASPLGAFGGGSKEPIKIDADRLDVFDRENRAVFTGNVVAVQGESTIRCTVLTVLYERGGAGGPKPAIPAAGATNDAIKQIDCTGPVTVVSKEQVGTGDNAVFDRVANKIVMLGNVTLSQCQNVTTGDKLVYDLNTGVANIESLASAAGPGRVRALFVPGGADAQGNQGCKAPGQAASPAASPAATPAPSAPAQAAQVKPDVKPAGRPRAAQTN